MNDFLLSAAYGCGFKMFSRCCEGKQSDFRSVGLERVISSSVLEERSGKLAGSAKIFLLSKAFWHEPRAASQRRCRAPSSTEVVDPAHL